MRRTVVILLAKITYKSDNKKWRFSYECNHVSWEVGIITKKGLTYIKAQLVQIAVNYEMLILLGVGTTTTLIASVLMQRAWFTSCHVVFAW